MQVQQVVEEREEHHELKPNVDLFLPQLVIVERTRRAEQTVEFLHEAEAERDHQVEFAQ